jgi:hypothetical protein
MFLIVFPTQTVFLDRLVDKATQRPTLSKVSILNRVGPVLVPRGVCRLIIGCTFIVKIGTICV